MLKTVIRKEILENLTGYKFSIITLLFTLLIFTSLLVMARDFQQRVENYEILRPEGKSPTAIVRPTPLSIFAKGLDENLCRAYEIDFGGQIEAGHKQQSVNVLFRLFTTPDLLYIIKVIMALCALLFAFDRISGEKEDGTLGLSLANALKRPHLILGKWIGGFASLAIPFLLAVFMGILLILLVFRIPLSGADWLKIVVFLVSALLYIGIFYSLGMLVSCTTHRPATSLVMALSLWAVLVFVLPNLGNIMAKQLIRLPSVQQLEMQREQIWIREVYERIHGGQSGEEMVDNIFLENDKLIADYRNRFQQRVNLSRNLTRISPAASFTFLASDLLGTGLREEVRVKHAVLEYRNRVWKQATADRDTGEEGYPVFTFRRSTLGEALGPETWSNMAILIVFNALFFSAAYVGFLRYDVR
jgi:ABC-type transport system involved in multi-copper enzyme maturation permease subunit